MTDDIVKFIEAQLAEDEAGALDAAAFYDNDPEDVTWRVDEGVNENGFKRAWLVPHLGVINDPASAHHMVRHSPARVLADVKAKRVILAEVLSWQHAYIDGDTWLSCAQAVSVFGEDGTPGSGCADEGRAGGPCDCGLDRRRATMLNALAAGYAGRPGFKDEWRLP